MNKSVTTKIGDVFCVAIDGKYKKYLQYIVSDLTQLNSDVVRTFKELYPIYTEFDMEEVVKGNVDRGTWASHAYYSNYYGSSPYEYEY